MSHQQKWQSMHSKVFPLCLQFIVIVLFLYTCRFISGDDPFLCDKVCFWGLFYSYFIVWIRLYRQFTSRSTSPLYFFNNFRTSGSLIDLFPFSLIYIFIVTMDITVEEFLQKASLFSLGFLPTEQGDPLTQSLSQLSKDDLSKAIDTLLQLDFRTLGILKEKLKELEVLHSAINQTLHSGHRVFISGCGATGRLAISIQNFWRRSSREGQVISFMSGGDSALVKSIQSFEDHPQFGEQQLRELGFGEDDLLVASTEGGQTWWVIGTVNCALKLSRREPFILYCNPDELLMKIERSRQFIENPGINKINLFTGNMAIRGSTRMQASSILQAAISIALMAQGDFLKYAEKTIEDLTDSIRTLNRDGIRRLIEFEASQYKAKRTVTYQSQDEYLITVFTDLTQRSPTFSIPPFQNSPLAMKSWAWVVTDGQRTKNGWPAILCRQLRALDSEYWKDFLQKTSSQTCMKWDFTNDKTRQGSKRIKISRGLLIEYQEGEFRLVESCPQDLYVQNLVLKMALNVLSTLIMGILQRYSGNVMTFVKPTNYKLIDRVVRNVRHLRKDLGFEEVARRVFKLREGLKDDEPIVLKVIESFDLEIK